MKPLSLLLAASLVANAAVVATWTLRPSAAGAPSGATTSPAASSSAAAKGAGAKAGDAKTADILTALKGDNVEALRDLLSEAGIPDETIRMVVGSAIWKRYSERMKALQPKPSADKPWWKEDNNWYGSMTREQRTEMRRLQREANEESIRILGPDKNNRGWGYQDARLTFLPEEKRKDIQEVEQDYQDLIQEVQQDMNGFALPSDSEKIRFLQEEKKRDLAAMLTPAELADYELRMSPTAQQLRWKMARFDATEDEYRKIFALQQSFDSGQQTDGWGNPINQGPDDWKKRQEAEKQLGDQLRQSLGADRYADYLRSQNHEYQQLAAATKRLSLPPETATKVYNLRNDVTAESQRIADNASLAYEQKKEALADLAKQTREQVRASLGAEAAEVYFKSGMHWLNNVEQGNLVTFSENGNQTGSRSLPRDPKKTTSKP